MAYALPKKGDSSGTHLIFLNKVERFQPVDYANRRGHLCHHCHGYGDQLDGSNVLLKPMTWPKGVHP